MADLDLVQNAQNRLNGELYWAFTSDLVKRRRKAAIGCSKYNASQGTVSRRQELELLQQIIPTIKPLPPALEDAEEDEKQLDQFPMVNAPFFADYGTEIRLGENVYINFNMIILDTCLVTIGSRTLFGPNVSLFSASHPLDPEIRQGTAGPENGKPITIGDDCWFGGNVVVCPGVTIENGCTVGAGSVVTKNVPAYCVVAGNPAKVLKRIDCPAARRHYGDDAFKPLQK